MANAQLLASDNFASGSLAAGWSVISGFLKSKVVGSGSSAVTEPNTTNTTTGQIWTALSWPNDQISEITLGAGFQSNSTTYCIPAVRVQIGSESGYFANITDGAAGTAALYVKTNGVATRLGSQVTGLTISPGDVWALCVAGAAISLYQNGKRIVYFYDTTYTSGYAGYEQFATTITQSQVASWRGYSVVQQDGIWKKQGIVVPAIASDLASSGFGAFQSSIIVDTNPQILSGTVLKMWFSGGGTSANIYYAESAVNDGINWTRRGSNVLTGFANGQVVKLGSIYHMYAQPSASQGSGNIAHYTSADGINWVQQSANVLALGGVGTWDAASLFVLASPVLLAGTWYMLYVGIASGGNNLFKTGVATSSDLSIWTKYGGNPVMSNSVASTPVNVNGVWYTWAASGPSSPQISNNNYDPGEGTRWKSNDLLNWIKDVHSVHHSEMFEALNAFTAPVGGCFPTSVLDVAGKAYLYSISSPGDGSAPQIYQIGLAIAPAPIASIITQPEDAVKQISTDAFTSGVGDLSPNWTTPTGGTKLQVIAGNLVEASTTSTLCGMFYNAANFSPDQYSEITIQTLTPSGQFVTPAVRMQPGSFSGYEIQFEGPTGSLATTFVIQKLVNGTATSLGSLQNITPQVGDVIRLQVTTGSDGFPVLSAFQNGTLVQQVQDYGNTFTNGNPGMIIFATALVDAQISLWAGGNANVIPSYGNSSSSWLTTALINSLRGLRH